MCKRSQIGSELLIQLEMDRWHNIPVVHYKSWTHEDTRISYKASGMTMLQNQSTVGNKKMLQLDHIMKTDGNADTNFVFDVLQSWKYKFNQRTKISKHCS